MIMRFFANLFNILLYIFYIYESFVGIGLAISSLTSLTLQNLVTSSDFLVLSVGILLVQWLENKRTSTMG